MGNGVDDSRKMNHIEECVRRSDRIFIDTCSVLYEAATPFFERLSAVLQKTGKKLYITRSVMAEMDRHQRNKEKPELAARAREGFRNLVKMDEAGLLEKIGNPEDESFADNIFLAVFTRFRMKYHLMLITQDRNLATEVDALNNSQAVNVKPNIVKSIDKDGYLRNFYPARNEKQDSAAPYASRSLTPNSAQCFRICREVTAVPDDALSVQHVPGEQEMAFTDSKAPVRLQKKLAEGGEGAIYETDTPQVAKIYKADKITRRCHEKLKLMMSKNLQCEGICFPEKLLYNQYGEFVGYLMPKAQGEELGSCVFRAQRLKRRFPDWKKRDLVELSLTIMEKIKYLNDRNIILGDINPKNILVVSAKEVYFVDTDSYQIEDYPCPVGMTNFTAPERQGIDYSSYLRQRSDDNFAIATLLFMIMLPGKPPYAQQGGETSDENIRKMDFSYPCGDKSNGKTPDGPWRFMWSHLAYKSVKEPFYNTFAKDGEYQKPKDRLSVDAWISNFSNYLELLDNGIMGKNDYMSEWIFPKRYKHSDKVKYTRCEVCGEMEVEEGRGTICRACMDDPGKAEHYRCAQCGTEMIYTMRDKAENKKRHVFCMTCGHQVLYQAECRTCHKTFQIAREEAAFLQAKGYHMPKNCPECRKRQRLQNASVLQQTKTFSGRRTASYESSSGSGWWSSLKKLLFG